MSALGALMDKRKLALAGAKFRAWWDGADFDEESVLAAIEAAVQNIEAEDGNKPAEAAAAEGAPKSPPPPVGGPSDERALEAALFDPQIDPRLQALQLLWGEGRIAPGDEMDEAAVIAKLGTPSALAIIGPGLGAPLRALAAQGRACSVFEWRGEMRAVLSEAAGSLPGVTVQGFDLDVSTLAQDAFDALVSFDDFTYAGFAPHLALQAARGVKAGGLAVMDCYVGPAGADLAHAFASAFAEPQIRQRAEIEHALSEAGFDFDAEEDLTEPHIALAKARFEALPALMTGEKAPKLGPGAARELAWETETWRVRLRMLARRRLERRRFVLRRRA